MRHEGTPGSVDSRTAAARRSANARRGPLRADLPGTAALVWAMLLFSGCQTGDPSQRAGGDCQYRDIPGICRIESIEPAGPTDRAKGFRTLFSFATTSAQERPAARAELTIGDGRHPTRRYLEANQIEVGRQFPCVRKVLTRGTCSPQVFAFPEFRQDD